MRSVAISILLASGVACSDPSPPQETLTPEPTSENPSVESCTLGVVGGVVVGEWVEGPEAEALETLCRPFVADGEECPPTGTSVHRRAALGAASRWALIRSERAEMSGEAQAGSGDACVAALQAARERFPDVLEIASVEGMAWPVRGRMARGDIELVSTDLPAAEQPRSYTCRVRGTAFTTLFSATGVGAASATESPCFEGAPAGLRSTRRQPTDPQQRGESGEVLVEYTCVVVGEGTEREGVGAGPTKSDACTEALNELCGESVDDCALEVTHLDGLAVDLFAQN